MLWFERGSGDGSIVMAYLVMAITNMLQSIGRFASLATAQESRHARDIRQTRLRLIFEMYSDDGSMTASHFIMLVRALVVCRDRG